MDHKQRLNEIAEFLKPYQRIWQNEIMLLYPEPFQDYPAAWLEEMVGFRSQSDLIRLEMKDVDGLIKGESLLKFYQRIEELCHFPGIGELPPFPENRFSFLYMIPKKQYEIRKLAPYVNKFFHERGMSNIIDIGGGIGNLALSLTNHYNLQTTSVDMDPVLQTTGKERQRKSAVPGFHQVQYANLKVAAGDESFSKLLSEDCMTLGLHTCGALANYQIQASIEKSIKGIISFGCCYDKLSRDPKSQNISSVGKKHNIHFDQFALTLAARAHRKMSDKDYAFKLKVKYYRYAIHFFLCDVYHHTKLASLGNSPHKLYDESFGTYAMEQLRRLNLDSHHTKEELDAFFENPHRQEMIHRMLAAGLIRNAFGRLMELYILLDRVCFLEEQGYKADLLEFFNETISPRNLGIVAERL